MRSLGVEADRAELNLTGAVHHSRFTISTTLLFLATFMVSLTSPLGSSRNMPGHCLTLSRHR